MTSCMTAARISSSSNHFGHFSPKSIPRTFIQQFDRNFRYLNTTTPFQGTVPTETSASQITPPPTDILQTSSKELWADDAAKILSEGETFASLGLGGYSPIGLIQSSMEIIYNTTGLPWWGTIVVSTLCFRVLFYPISIYLQKHAIRMHNVNPQVEELKEKQMLYLLAGNMEMANYQRNKINAVFRSHGIRPFLSLLPVFFQGAFLLSYFMAIRRMAYAPVTSMMTGGALWFTDLTVPDDMFILPIINSLGFLISIEV